MTRCRTPDSRSARTGGGAAYRRTACWWRVAGEIADLGRPASCCHVQGDAAAPACVALDDGAGRRGRASRMMKVAPVGDVDRAGKWSAAWLVGRPGCSPPHAPVSSVKPQRGVAYCRTYRSGSPQCVRTSASPRRNDHAPCAVASRWWRPGLIDCKMHHGVAGRSAKRIMAVMYQWPTTRCRTPDLGPASAGGAQRIDHRAAGGGLPARSVSVAVRPVCCHCQVTLADQSPFCPTYRGQLQLGAVVEQYQPWCRLRRFPADGLRRLVGGRPNR